MFLPGADRRAVLLFFISFAPFPTARTALISLLGLTCGHAIAQTSQLDDQQSKVSGTVVNYITKAPIARALVYTTDNHLAMLTDGEGHFELTLPKGNTGTMGGRMYFSRGGEYSNCSSWLQARKPGFLDCIDLPTAPDGDLTIALVPEALIHGRVSVGNGEPLSETEVQLFYRDVMDGLPRWVPRKSVRTNSAGEFRFADLPAGEYKLLTHERIDDDPATDKPGQMHAYPPVFYPSAADFSSVQAIHLSAGQSVEADLVATRQPYHRVDIPVVNTDISSGLNVTVRSQAGPGYALGYSPSRKRIEGSLPNGNYLVEATAFPPNAASGMVNLKVDGAAAEAPAMTLISGGSITLDVKENFSDKSTWNGASTWNVGNRMITLHGVRAYLSVQLETADESEAMRGTSLRPPTGPNDESLVLENVLPGRYWVRLNSGRGYVASARMGDVDLLRQPLVVTAGPSAPIEVELRDDTAEIGGSVTGLASASPGTEAQGPQRRGFVYCVPLPDSPGQFVTLSLFGDGQFEYQSMAPGAYRILAFASAQNHLPYRDAEAMKGYETRGPVVHLSAGQKVSVQVPLISESDVSEK